MDVKRDPDTGKIRLKEKHKKALILTGLFALVVAAGVLNYTVTSSPGETNSVMAQKSDVEADSSGGLYDEDAFETFRQERATVREQELSYIESVVTSSETDEKTKEEAQKQKLALAGNMEKELLSEGVLKTSMGIDAVVSVSSDLVSVVVGADELTDAEAAQIAEIIIDQTGIPAQNIKIIPQS